MLKRVKYIPPALLSLYHDAFPPDERRTDESLKQLAAHNPRFCFYEVIDNEPIGFLTAWTFDTFRYIEHFAIFAHLRNSGAGSRALREFIAGDTLPVVLEAERPDTCSPDAAALAQRRLCFYERAGLRIIDSNYIQPPYTPESNSVPLFILATDEVSGAAHTLIREVYGAND